MNPFAADWPGNLNNLKFPGNFIVFVEVADRKTQQFIAFLNYYNPFRKSLKLLPKGIFAIPFLAIDFPVEF